MFSSFDNIQDDKYSTDKGGLVYAVVVNLTRKWITVVFRGTIGVADWWTNFDYRLNHDSFFGEEGDITAGGNPGTHNGFTGYLVSERTSDSVERPYIDRILACVNGEFKDNPDVAGKGFKFFVTGHSLGGGMANLFAFRAAQLKSKDDESVKYLPETIKAMTVAAPCVGNFDYNDEFQALEKKGFLRHLRISSEFDVVPTNTLPPVPIIFRGGNTKVYTQNGLNLFLQEGKKMVVNYRNTKSFWSQVLFNVFKVIDSHSPGVHYSRLNTIPGNQEVLEVSCQVGYGVAPNKTVKPFPLNNMGNCLSQFNENWCAGPYLNHAFSFSFFLSFFNFDTHCALHALLRQIGFIARYLSQHTSLHFLTNQQTLEEIYKEAGDFTD